MYYCFSVISPTALPSTVSSSLRNLPRFGDDGQGAYTLHGKPLRRPAMVGWLEESRCLAEDGGHWYPPVASLMRRRFPLMFEEASAAESVAACRSADRFYLEASVGPLHGSSSLTQVAGLRWASDAYLSAVSVLRTSIMRHKIPTR